MKKKLSLSVVAMSLLSQPVFSQAAWNEWRRINRIYKMESARVSYHDYPTSPSSKTGS